ncbi:hypothetical protein PV325_010130 [Microctonus aethiopoides]|nr:hypothetical protein PV325_010130 [Microctonus aethiopoides]
MSSFMIVIHLVAVVIALSEAGGDDDGVHDHVIIHVPYHIKTIKHTHTITKHIHHKDNGDGDKFELLGYTYGHPIDLGGHGGNNIGAWSNNDYGGYELGSEHVRGHEGY